MNLRVVTPPALEPVTLAEAKLHLRVDHDDEDTLITALIVAAREQAETFCRRRLIETTLRLDLDRFPVNGAPIRLPYPPAISVTSIVYLDQDGVSQTLDAAAYRFIADPMGATIEPEFDYSWPITRQVGAAVQVTFKAGFGTTAASVKPAIKQAMLMLVGHYFENREAVAFNAAAMPLPLGVESLLYTQRAYEFS